MTVPMDLGLVSFDKFGILQHDSNCSPAHAVNLKAQRAYKCVKSGKSMRNTQNRRPKTELRSRGQAIATGIARTIETLKTDRTARRFVILCGSLLLAALLLHRLERRHSATAIGGPQQLITEFMASNDSTLADQDGDYSDWIEIHNREAIDIDLDGWYLTDDDNDLTKWQFPTTILPAGGYLIVFASHKDRAVSGSELHTNFKLDNSGEYLALVKPDGITVAWEYAPDVQEVPFASIGNLFRRQRVTPQYVPQFGDISYGLDAAWNERYFTQPTPGMANSTAKSDWGPMLSKIEHTPRYPTPGEDIVVTAAVENAPVAVDTITLHCRIMYRDVIQIPMADDGAHGDGQAGDGIYGAIIPGSTNSSAVDPAHVPQAGEMVRYHLTATDTQGNKSRWPFFHDPVNSPRYFGTMVADPSVTSTLPTLYWFVQDPEAAQTLYGTRAELFYNGAFYDNVFVRRRGYSSRTGWPKKSFKFEFNRGYYFQFSPDHAPVEELNLNNTYSDKSYIRQILSWEAYRDAGVPYSISFPMRVQQNGTFHSVAIFVEQPDKRYLERNGLDTTGALYKMFNALDSATSRVAKRTRKQEDHRDLQALIDGIHLAGQARTHYLFDHINVPAVVNYLAVTTVLHDTDCADKNYYLYRDTEGTGEWMLLPWDKDLTFGRNFDGHVLKDAIWADRDPPSSPLSLDGNHLIQALYDTPETREMYLCRLRTIMDEQLQPPGTPPGERYFERRIDELYERMLPDVTLDAAAWTIEWGTPQTFTQALRILKDDYLAVRRVHLYETYGPNGKGMIPSAQPDTAAVQFGDIGFVSTGENPDCEYLTLVNRNRYAVDISNWTIGGTIQYTFQPGVVIPARGTLYVTPDVVAFRNRTTSPTGNEGRFVQGGYRGRVSNNEGMLYLYTADGALAASKAFFDLRPFVEPKTVPLF
jgi:hypothetical protein